jgi:pimeloyl-ACP methyl ester carboxylesterase
VDARDEPGHGEGESSNVMTLAPSGFLSIDDSNLEYRMLGPSPDQAPTLVLLHEGLGSAALWGDFPEQLQAATGLGVFVYSRAGYGASSPATLPRPLDYMQREALDVLPKLLDAIGFERGLLVGHSDGASIAAIYAGGVEDHRLNGLVLMAPQDVDNAFYGWNGAWLDPKFRAWDISDFLAYIRVPIAIIQGADDQYGSVRQVEIAQEECYCPVEVTILAGTGHSPHREAPGATLNAISDFANAVLRTHEEGRAA